MAINQDYSLKDTKDVYEELLDAVEAMTTKWNPRNSTEADPGVVILKLIALLEDKNNYKSDMARNQGYLDTVVDRESAYDLLEMLGYIMKQARCATGTVTITAINRSSTWAENVGEGNSVTIPRFTILTDSSGTLSFFTLHDLEVSYATVTANSKWTYNLEVQAGEPFQITKDGVSTFSLKDIDEDGRLYLGKTNLAQNGVFVYTYVPDSTDSTTGTEVDNSWTYLDFAILKPEGNWYTVHTSADSETYIQFPDNFEELIGSLQFVVYGTYTDGAASNISSGLLSLWDGDTYKDYFSITQTDEFTNGQDEESIETASDNYYATKDVCDTLVSAQDYESAIKYLTVQQSSAIKSTSDIGERYFSNAVVRTGQERRTKVRTAAYGVAYDLYIPDRSVPSTQVDVIGLKSSTTYEGTFERYADEASANAIESDTQEQLQDNTTLDVDIVLDTSYPRILAVTTPEMTIRIQNYSTTAASTLRSDIKEYFETNYSADNLVPGEELDVQTIIDDIKELSSDILSVSMNTLSYTNYLTYETVDSKESQAVLDDEEFVTEVVARAVLAGDVPLFRYYNRYNTLTKQTAIYSTVAAISEDSDLETVLTVPFNTTDYNEDITSTGTALVPKIVELVVQPTQNAVYFYNDDDGDSAYYANTSGSTCYGFQLANTHIVQFRKPLHTANTTYSYGMKWLLYGIALSSDLNIQTTTELGISTVLAAGSTIITTATFTDLTADTTTNEGYNTYVLTTAISIDTLSSGTALAIEAGSVLAAGTKIAIGSTVNGSTYYPTAAEDGDEYLLKGDETLVITYSDGTAAATYTAGTWIQPSGVSLSFSTNASSDSSVLSTTATISILVNDSSTVTEEYVYFLSLRRPSGTNVLLCSEDMLTETFSTSTSGEITTYADAGYVSEYMLEDDELFVYADVGITEYVSLGPGTVLRLTEKGQAIELINTPYTTLDEILATDFREVPCEIEAQSYELTSYLYQDGRALIWSSKYADLYPTEFTTISDDYPIYIVSDSEIVSTADVTSSDTNYTGIATDTFLGATEATFNNSIYETRIAVNLESDSNGVLEIQYPISITLQYEDADGNTVYDEDGSVSTTTLAPEQSESGTSTTYTRIYLVSSTTYSAVFTAVESGDEASLLLVPGATARISKATLSSFTSISNTGVSTEVTNDIDELSVSLTSSSDWALADPTDISNFTYFMRFSLPCVEREGSTESSRLFYTAMFRLTFDISDMENSFVDGDQLIITPTAISGSLTNVKRIYCVNNTIPLPDGTDNTSLTIDLASALQCGTTIGIEFDADKFDSTNPCTVLWFSLCSSSKTAYGDFGGLKVTVSDLSYIQQYATELLANTEDITDSEQYDLDFYSGDNETNGYDVLKKMQELDTEKRYDYLTLPTEAYSNPTLAASFFEESHPFNSVTFPYIEFSASKIKIIKGR